MGLRSDSPRSRRPALRLSDRSIPLAVAAAVALCATVGLSPRSADASRWTGAASDQNWSTAGNWSPDYDGGSTPPANGNSLWFDSQSTATNHAIFTSAQGTLSIVNLNMYQTSYLEQTGGTLDATNFVGLATDPGSNSFFTLSGTGTFGVTGEFQVGVNAAGTFTMNGGSASSTSYLVIGRNDGSSGVVNVTAGTMDAATTNGFTTLASTGGGSGTLSVSGSGTFNSIRGIYVGEGIFSGSGTATGTLNVSGNGTVNTGTSAITLAQNNASASSGTVNLDGGTIQTAAIAKGTGGSAVFNFNGGTLQATTSNASFMTGLSSANVKSGGAVIDTNSFNVTVSQALLADGTSIGGGLAKNGDGALTLANNNTYVGGTTVYGGTLNLSVGGQVGAIRGALTINPNATVNLTTGDALGWGTGTAVTQINVNGGTLNNQSGDYNGFIASWSLTGGTIKSDGGGVYQINATNGNTITSNASPTTSLISATVQIRTADSTLAIDVADGAAAEDLRVTGGFRDSQFESSANGISKSGSGTLVLAGNSTYSGGTAINGGRVFANAANATGSGKVSVNSTATLAGSGQVAGAVDVNDGGTISAGGSENVVGSLITGTQTWKGGGSYAWKIGDATAGSGAGWDTLTMATLDLSNLPAASKFTIKVSSLDGPSAGAPANFVATNSYRFLIAHVNDVGFVAPSNPLSLFALDTSGFAYPSGSQPGSFTLSFGAGATNGDIYVDYQSTPEPTTTVLFAASAIAALTPWRRRTVAPRTDERS